MAPLAQGLGFLASALPGSARRPWATAGRVPAPWDSPPQPIGLGTRPLGAASPAARAVGQLAQALGPEGLGQGFGEGPGGNLEKTLGEGAWDRPSLGSGEPSRGTFQGSLPGEPSRGAFQRLYWKASPGRPPLEGSPGRLPWKAPLEGSPGRLPWKVPLQGPPGRLPWKVSPGRLTLEGSAGRLSAREPSRGTFQGEPPRGAQRSLPGEPSRGA